MAKQKLVSNAEFSRTFGVSESRVSRLAKSTFSPAMVGKRIDMAHPIVKLYIAKRRAAELKAAKIELAEAEQAAKDAPPAQKQRKTRKKAKKTPAKNRTKRKTTRAKAGVVDETDTRHAGAEQNEPKTKLEILKDLISGAGKPPPDDEELRTFAEMSLETIIKRYGTMTQFKDLLSATKLIEDILEKRIKNAKTSGDLISREHVHTFVFGAIEAINIRLIQDSPRTISARVITALESGETKEQIEVIIRDLLSSQIRGMKKEVTKGMKSA